MKNTRGWMDVAFEGYDPDNVHATRHVESESLTTIYADEVGFEIVWKENGALEFADCMDADEVNARLKQLGIDPDTGWK